MRCKYIFLLLMALPTCCTSCLVLPLPYLHSSYIPAHDLPTSDDVIVTAITQRMMMAGIPCIPYESKNQSVHLIAIESGKLPSQFSTKPECFFAFIAPSMLMMIPLPGYRWDHDTVSLRVYRSGYQTVTLKSWDWSAIQWKPVNSCEERELAIDQLLYADTPVDAGGFFLVPQPENGKVLESIDNADWFASKRDWLDVENSTAVKKQIQQTLRRVAQEYLVLEDELTRATGYDQQRKRLAEKRLQALLLANGLFETSSSDTEELAIGSPANVQKAHTYLLENSIPTSVVLKDRVTLFVSTYHYNQASTLLMNKHNLFAKDLIIREPKKESTK